MTVTVTITATVTVTVTVMKQILLTIKKSLIAAEKLAKKVVKNYVFR